MTIENRKYPPVPARKPLRPSRPLVDEELKNFIKINEDSKSHFYRDTKDKVTIGYGQMIPDAETAEKLPLYLYSTNNKKIREAMPSEKREAFMRVKSYDAGRNASAEAYNPAHNQRLLNIHIDKPDMEWALEQRLREGERHLKRAFPEFESYPRPAQIALFDMEYNLGPTKFRPNRIDPKTGEEEGWPKLFDAINRRDWKQAAEQSHRRDIDDQRNQKAQNLFLESARWDGR